MNQEQEIKALKRQVNELLEWKALKTRQQISFPLDIVSKNVLNKDFLDINKIENNQVSLVDFASSFLAAYSYADTGGFKVHRTLIGNGENTINNPGKSNETLNTNLTLENQDTASNQSFLYGTRKPYYQSKSNSSVTVTSTQSTVTDSSKNFATNELAGAFINIYDSSEAFQFTRQIASNTATVITIDGTWPATVSGGKYAVFMPILLGSADNPWSSLYSLGLDVSSGGDGSARRALRMGFGPSSGTDVISIFFGTGSPESVVTANIGSLFLRTDGSTSTTLYVKTSGTGNTGWTAK